MKSISHATRLWEIQRTLLRYQLLEIFISKKSHLYYLVLLTRWNPWYRRKEKSLSRGERLRLALQELGPFFIKFGQLLSTRRDILPDDIADELTKLQDKVAASTKPDIHTLMAQALSEIGDQAFKAVDSTPLASASIAQVHAAVLTSGEQVVIKVRRPGIKKIINRDLSLLKSLARKATPYFAHGARLLAIVDEIEQTIYTELDFLKEAASQSQLKRQLSDIPYVKIPEVVWPLSRHNFLVMERIYGIPLNDINQLQESGVDLKKLAENITRLFFHQVFQHGMFHADMHAGNLFLENSNSLSPRIILVDFGMVGTLDSHDLRYLAQNLDAFLKGDYRRIAELHVESGWVPADVRIDQFTMAISSVCEPLQALPLKDISFGKVMMGLLKTASEFKAHVQPQLILLQKTLITVEGLSRQLDPTVSFFDIARESVETWMRKRSGLSGFMNELKKHGPQIVQQLSALPEWLAVNLQESQKPKTQIPEKVFSSPSQFFWRGVGIASLISSIGLSAFLIGYAPEITTWSDWAHTMSLTFTTGLGVFGLISLFWGRPQN